jgi:hypothetical protein
VPSRRPHHLPSCRRGPPPSALELHLIRVRPLQASRQRSHPLHSPQVIIELAVGGSRVAVVVPPSSQAVLSVSAIAIKGYLVAVRAGVRRCRWCSAPRLVVPPQSTPSPWARARRSSTSRERSQPCGPHARSGRLARWAAAPER